MPTRSAGDDVTSGDAVLGRALELVRFLRANCEWDAAQTPHSLLPYLLEEAHETADAIATGTPHDLTGELGDLLLNVAFQIVIAEERDAFDAADVVTRLEAKMRRRHPHLYGDGERVDWDTSKAAERAEGDTPASLLDDVASGLEPLTRAYRIQQCVAEVGFDWPSAHGALDKVVEEVEEVREHLDDTAAPVTRSADMPDAANTDALEDELGDLLFAVVNLARLSNVHPTGALVRANAKFAARFRGLETLARERGVVLGEASLEALDALWEEVKLSGR